jgi:hypothetical protein
MKVQRVDTTVVSDVGRDVLQFSRVFDFDRIYVGSVSVPVLDVEIVRFCTSPVTLLDVFLDDRAKVSRRDIAVDN